MINHQGEPRPNQNEPASTDQLGLLSEPPLAACRSETLEALSSRQLRYKGLLAVIHSQSALQVITPTGC
jgi:hypothetical protein